MIQQYVDGKIQIVLPDGPGRGRVHPRSRPGDAGTCRQDPLLAVQSLILGLLLGGLYALLAAGLTLYFGVMRVVMIAHSAFLILAAYLAWYFHTRDRGSTRCSRWSVTVPLFFVAGVAMQRLLLSRLRPATLTMMSVLLTFAIALTIEGMLGYVFTGTQRRIQLGYSRQQLRDLRRPHRGGQADRVRAGRRRRCSRSTCC